MSLCDGPIASMSFQLRLCRVYVDHDATMTTQEHVDRARLRPHSQEERNYMASGAEQVPGQLSHAHLETPQL